MKWRHVAPLTLLAASLARIAGAQQADPMPDPLARLDVQSRRQIQLLVDSARGVRLPWAAVRLKAIEGANKKFDGKVVLKAVRLYVATLGQAKSILGPLASDEEVETGASVLSAGIRPEDLAQFRVTTQGRSPTRALVYLADLIDKHNVPRDDAVEAFAKLWKDGAADADLEGLWRNVDQDILGGVNPRAAFLNRIRSLPPLRKPPAE
jgi:hypothetical protein